MLSEMNRYGGVMLQKKCPNCGQEMDQGRLFINHSIAWSDDINKKHSYYLGFLEHLQRLPILRFKERIPPVY